MIGVLIVTWNRRDDLLDCIGSVMRSDYPNLAVYVVDNASSDGTAHAVTERFPEVNLIRSDENLGFAAGNNLGLKRMLADGADWVFLLNDDAVVAEDAIRILTAYGDDMPGAGVLAPKITLHSQPEIIWSAGGTVDPRTGTATQRHYGEVDRGQADEPSEVDYAVGCAALVRADAVRRAGLIDEDYFMYYEETDWCRRIRSSGYRVVYVPESVVRHKVTMDRDTRSHAVYYCARNRLLYLSRSGAGASRIASAAGGILRSMLGHAVHGRIRESRMMLKAVGDYHAGRFGKLRCN